MEAVLTTILYVLTVSTVPARTLHDGLEIVYYEFEGVNVNRRA
jgi:hypothetical protein